MKNPTTLHEWSQNVIFCTCLFFLISVATSCGIGEKIKDAADNLTNIFNSSNIIIDDAVNKLQGDASNFKQILQEAIDKATSQNLKAQLKEILEAGIVTGSTEIRCDLQFTADYLIKRLQALKANLNHTTPVPMSPKVCTNLPPLIDMNLPPNSRNTALITGYFLKEDVSKYKLLLRKTNGSSINATSNLTVSSDFKLIINLGSTGIVLDQFSDKLILYWNNDLVTEIPIVQKLPEKCELRERELTELPKMVLYPQRMVCPWNQRSGDLEFWGHGPCTIGDVNIFTKNNGTELWARTLIKMWECPDDLSLISYDYSYGEASQEVKLITIDTGWRIKTIKSGISTSFQNIDKSGNQTEKFSGAGPVLNYLVQGDLDGNDLGNSRVEITFAVVSVTLEKIGDCIPN
jgi:hypothetical protein